MRLLGVLLTLVLAVSVPAHAKLDAHYERSVGILSFGQYEPDQAKSWGEIPAAARERIQAHLLARLGQDQYDRLRFVRAQVVDVEKLKLDEPNSVNYRWEIPAYRIVVSTSFPNAKIRKFEAEILARKDGSLIKEVDLPCFACPGKGQLLSVSDASRIAEAKGFSPALLSAYLGYSEKAESIYWEFRQVSKRDKYGVEYRAIQVDAHNGNALFVGSGESIF